MPTPIFNVRLPQKDQDALRAFSKIYGSANVSDFVREVLMVMVSGQPEKVKEFNRRLVMATGEQMLLQMNAPLEGVETAKKPAPKPKPKRRTRAPAP